MDEPQQGLLKSSLRFVKDALNENTLLRTSVLVTVLCIILAAILLTALGVASGWEQGKPQAYSPRWFGVLFLPTEFLIYDLILGNSAPRAALKDMYLDKRLLGWVWNNIKMLFTLFVPTLMVGLLLVGLTFGFDKTTKINDRQAAVFFLALFALIAGGIYFISRFFYLSVVVARRDPQPLRTAFRESKGRLWKISCAIFLPYLAMLLATIPMELLGPVLERNLGFVALAPWFLVDAGVYAFCSCLSAAVLALSYQRIVLPGAQEPPGTNPAASLASRAAVSSC